jgi:hypothetical protein
MTRHSLTLAAAALLLMPGAALAQNGPDWQNSAPAITASATVNAVRQYNHDPASFAHLSFGNNGVTPGVEAVVTTAASDAATGTSAKVEVRFNAASRITASGSSLTYNDGTTIHTITPTYECDRAATSTGTGTGFTCGSGTTDGVTFAAGDITGMMQMFVRVGATIPAAETNTKPAGTYGGTITINVAAPST